MKRLHMDKRDGLAWIALDDGKANAIQEELLSQLDVALDTAERDPDLSAVVLAGRDGFFSAGMDLKLLPTLPTPELHKTLTHLARTTTRLFCFPKPVVAAITGHAVAGGAVLALCCDARVAAVGTYRIGLSEVSIGIAMPSFIIGFARETLPNAMVAPMLLHGTLMEPEEALRFGVVHELSELSEVRNRAGAQARKLGELKLSAYAETKRRLRGHAAQQNLEKLNEEIDAFAQSFRAPLR
jgi:enoyl-CoA hydratase